MICTLSVSIILAICHYSYSLENPHSNFENQQQQSSYVNRDLYEKPPPTHASKQSNIAESKLHEKPPPAHASKQSNTAESNQDTQRRNHYSSYSSDVPRYKEKMWRFELDVPDVLNALKKYTGVSITDAKKSSSLRAKDDSFLGQKIRFEVKPPNIAALMGYISDFMNVQSARRFNQVYYGYVEEGPGTIKSGQVDYPPRYQEGRLKTLVRLKKRMKG